MRLAHPSRCLLGAHVGVVLPERIDASHDDGSEDDLAVDLGSRLRTSEGSAQNHLPGLVRGVVTRRLDEHDPLGGAEDHGTAVVCDEALASVVAVLVHAKDLGGTDEGCRRGKDELERRSRRLRARLTMRVRPEDALLRPFEQILLSKARPDLLHVAHRAGGRLEDSATALFDRLDARSNEGELLSKFRLARVVVEDEVGAVGEMQGVFVA